MYIKRVRLNRLMEKHGCRSNVLLPTAESSCVVVFMLGSLQPYCQCSKVPQRGPEWNPSRKRIRCTLKLSESHCMVAMILNILSTMFYVFEEINWRWCRHNTLPLSHIRSTVSDGVSPSPEKGGTRSPSKSATGSHNFMAHFCTQATTNSVLTFYFVMILQLNVYVMLTVNGLCNNIVCYAVK